MTFVFDFWLEFGIGMGDWDRDWGLGIGIGDWDGGVIGEGLGNGNWD